MAGDGASQRRETEAACREAPPKDCTAGVPVSQSRDPPRPGEQKQSHRRGEETGRNQPGPESSEEGDETLFGVSLSLLSVSCSHQMKPRTPQFQPQFLDEALHLSVWGLF